MSTQLTLRGQFAHALPRADYVLQQTGARPLRFVGSLLASSDDSAAAAWARLHLALYTCAGFYVTEMRGDPGYPGRVWCSAARHDTLEDALCAFEAMEPAPEIPDDIGLGCGALDALAHAIARQAQTQAQINAWRHAVSKFLHLLCERWAFTRQDESASVW